MDHVGWRAGLAVAALLLLPPLRAAEPGGESPSPERIAELDNTLRQDCGSCHGLTLRGGLGKPLTAEVIATRSDEYLFAVIRDGIAGTPMAPWGQILSDDDIRIIINLLRQQ